MSNYEDKIIQILRAASIKFEREKTFEDLRQGRYRFDFYLPGHKILIEVDGQFHWKPIRGRKELLAQQERDRRKNSYCLAHDIPLYRIPYWEIENLHNFKDLIQKKFRVTSRYHNDYLNVPK